MTARPLLCTLRLLPVLACLSCEKPGTQGAVDAPPTITTEGGVEMVLIPAGSFEMGSRSGKEDATSLHRVSLNAFLMDKYEVTQAEFDRLHLANPSHFKGPTLPAEQGTWAQAAWFCNARSENESLRPCYNTEAKSDFDADVYRLPTAAECADAFLAATNPDHSFR